MTDTPIDLPRGLKLMWGIDDGARRGPKPALTAEAITTAAVGIADAEGLAAVSMSKIAKALGYTAMSLYRYVDSKQDLVEMMVDAVYGSPPELAGGADWREQSADWTRGVVERLRRHPWVLQVQLDTPPVWPNSTAWMEQGLRALAGTGLDVQRKLSALLMLEGYARNNVAMVQQFAGGDADDAGLGERYVARMRALVDPERFPEVFGAVVAGGFEGEGDFPQDEFEFGLEVILNGIAKLTRHRAR